MENNNIIYRYIIIINFMEITDQVTHLLVDFVTKVGQCRGERNFGQVGFLAYDGDGSLHWVARRHDLAKLYIDHPSRSS